MSISKMYKYNLHGLNLHTEVYLPELVQKESHKADIKICFGKVDPFEELSLYDGFNFRETKTALYRFWDNVGRFKISNGNEVIVEPANDVDEIVLRKFLLGTVMANLFHQRGYLVIHASAVNINNSAIAFLGDKNKGKSTTALEFYKAGYPVVADDYVPIQFEDGIPMVFAGFPQLKLSSKSLRHFDFDFKENINFSSYDDKLFIPTKKSFSQNKLPIKYIYVLERSEKNCFDVLNPQDGFLELVKNTFGITRFNKQDLRRSFLQSNTLLENVKIKSLKIGQLEHLNELVKLVEEDIHKNSSNV